MTISLFKGTYGFLSNFHEGDPFEWRGKVWPTSEHAFQAAKAVDPADAERIRLLRTPYEAKQAGRKVRMRPDWNSVRFAVMEEVVRAKFSLPPLRDALLATGDEELVEGNWWHDTTWGVCRGVGENWLGRILMKVRAGLKPPS